MAIVIVYGLYNLVIASKLKLAAPNATMRASELQSFVTQTTATIGSDMPSVFDIYVASRAGSTWERNPFYRKGGAEDNSRSRPKEKAPLQSLFVYSGYIETGTRKVAVINDTEYVAGDPLVDMKGLFVKRISPSSVLIENRKDKTEFEVPINEDR